MAISQASRERTDPPRRDRRSLPAVSRAIRGLCRHCSRGHGHYSQSEDRYYSLNDSESALETRRANSKEVGAPLDEAVTVAFVRGEAVEVPGRNYSNKSN